MTPDFVIVALVLWVAPIVAGHELGKRKQRSGFIYGLFLGWIGVAILALLPARGDARQATCPYCAETVKLAATVCRHCGREMTSSPGWVREG